MALAKLRVTRGYQISGYAGQGSPWLGETDEHTLVSAIETLERLTAALLVCFLFTGEFFAEKLAASRRVLLWGGPRPVPSFRSAPWLGKPMTGFLLALGFAVLLVGVMFKTAQGEDWGP